MLQDDKIQKIPEWSRKYNNRWCDYIELLCLCSIDRIISKDDFIERFLVDSTETGNESHSAHYDAIASWVDDLFCAIEYRSQNVSEYYPFDFERDCIIIKSNITNKNWQYLYLLMCSCIAFLDKKSSQRLTMSFEEYCLVIFRFLVSCDSEVHLFGTSREGKLFKGNLRTRIEKLASCLGTQTTKSFDNDIQFDVPGGDEGIDLVAFNKLDNATHIPLALGQCTCSYDKWIVKQEDISSEYWNKKIECLAPFGKYMFVPFFCRMADGKFEKPTTISTCLIDRQRILKILESHSEIIDEKNILNVKSIINCTCGICF